MANKNLSPIYIVGPTASGKSELAIRLARAFDGVIISADSMQIYRGLDIGTAKVSQEVRQAIPHKLIDILNVDEEFSVAEFARMAKIEIENAQNQNKLPIVVGGTGLYFEALIYPMSFASTMKNQPLREYLVTFLATNGAGSLHKMLGFFDPDSAKRLNVNDSKRVVRALEIVLTTRKPMAESGDSMQKEHIDATMIGLNCDRALLYERIDERVDKMFEQGLVDEALSVGSFDYQSMQAIGYKEFKQLEFDVVDGVKVPNIASLEKIKALIKQHTRNYAKRQLTWFKRYAFAKWFDSVQLDQAVEYTKSVIYRTV